VIWLSVVGLLGGKAENDAQQRGNTFKRRHTTCFMMRVKTALGSSLSSIDDAIAVRCGKTSRSDQTEKELKFQRVLRKL